MAPPKSWLHILQPALSYRFVEREELAAPVDFMELVAACPVPALREASLAALAVKRGEMGDLPEGLWPTVLEEGLAVIEDSRNIVDVEREVDQDRLQEAESLAHDIIFAMDPAYGHPVTPQPPRFG